MTTESFASFASTEGMPSSGRDPKGYGAADRQVALWKAQKLVTPVVRPLNYRVPNAPKEKGIDVRIAIDFVLGAVNNLYDVGVLFSNDTDLAPALEAVVDMKGPAACEVATWSPIAAHPTPLRVKGVKIHYLNHRDYSHIHDPTDYTQRRRRR